MLLICTKFDLPLLTCVYKQTNIQESKYIYIYTIILGAHIHAYFTVLQCSITFIPDK